MTILSRFNRKGIEEFTSILDGIRQNGGCGEIPKHILTDPRFVEPIRPVREIKHKVSTNKFVIIPQICDSLRGLSVNALDKDHGMWTWLAAFFFDSICPIQKNGIRKMLDINNYVSSSKRATRHKLSYACMRYMEVPTTNDMYLEKNFPNMSEALLQTGSHNRTMYSKNIQELIMLLFFDKKTMTLKKGVSDKNGPVIRRLITVVKQLDVSYNVEVLSPRELAKLLPVEFDPYKP